jgi:putative MATE family efflux protein
MKTNDMLQAPVSRLLLRMAVPAATGLFFNTMFNVTDTFYTRFISPDALAGLGLSFPVYLILIAVGAGLGNAVQALSANALGRGDEEKGAALGVSGLTLAAAAVLVLMLIGFPLLKPAIGLMGASGNSLGEALSYSRVILAGLMFFALNASLNGILSARGDTASYRNFLIIGFFANLALDPLFIFVFNMGTSGIALATILVQLIGTIYLGFRVRRLQLRKNSGKVGIRETAKEWRELLSHAVPVSMNVMTVALGVFVINYFLMRYGADAAVAGYGAAIRIEQVFLLPIMGLNTAVVTLVGQNNGAGRLDRVRESWYRGQLFGVMVMTVGFLCLFPLRSFWVGLFTPDADVIAAGAGYLSVEVFSMFSYVFLNMGVSTLQGLRKPGFIFIIGLSRQIILPPLVFYLLGDVFGMGIWGVWWGLFIIPTLAAAVTVFYTRHRLNLADEQGRISPVEEKNE